MVTAILCAPGSRPVVPNSMAGSLLTGCPSICHWKAAPSGGVPGAVIFIEVPGQSSTAAGACRFMLRFGHGVPTGRLLPSQQACMGGGGGGGGGVGASPPKVKLNPVVYRRPCWLLSLAVRKFCRRVNR